ncbi:MAG: microviridin/marinostatin family tricyclic proteinase inhibitor [Dinghuibacter sp.]|nr:microviridin/marinostatin family tricyclic proteinase inhibitor [Dinghuibacter sp.]
MKKKLSKRNVQLPFFAQLLTKQQVNQVAGAGVTSLLKDMVQTMKYPSDNEETTPSADTVWP